MIFKVNSCNVPRSVIHRCHFAIQKYILPPPVLMFRVPCTLHSTSRSLCFVTFVNMQSCAVDVDPYNRVS